MYSPVDSKVNFPEEELKVLDFWKKNNIVKNLFVFIVVLLFKRVAQNLKCNYKQSGNNNKNKNQKTDS